MIEMTRAARPEPDHIGLTSSRKSLGNSGVVSRRAALSIRFMFLRYRKLRLRRLRARKYLSNVSRHAEGPPQRVWLRRPFCALRRCLRLVSLGHGLVPAPGDRFT